MTGSQPYIGPRPFEGDDADKRRFFGRDVEASALLSRVIAHPSLLFYSPSGAGKTSLLNAKLIPMLEKEGFSVFTPGRVRDLTPADIDVAGAQNIYVFNALRSWDKNRTDSKLLINMSLADYLKVGAPANEADGHQPRVAIFDQFEEMFIFNSERWEDRQKFFEQIGEILEGDRVMRVMFIIREDYIAELDPYLHLLPEKLRTRYRLERLTEEKALLAITGPLKHTDYSFAEGVAEQLVSNLLMVPVETTAGVKKIKGEFVEPVHLQVVCQALWENCQTSWQELKPSERRVITLEQLETFGDVDQALSVFYERTIEKVGRSSGVSEGKLRAWFEKTLITPVGTRGTVYRGSEDSGGIPSTAVDEFVSHHLIVSEIRGGARWIELAHDRLIGPIKTSNENWKLRHLSDEQTRKLLEDKATKWAQSGRKSSDLLGDAELPEAERWLESPHAANVGVSNALFALVKSSKATIEEAARKREEALSEEQRKTARRLFWLTIVLGAFLLLSVGAVIFSLTKFNDALEEKEKVIRLAKLYKEGGGALGLGNEDLAASSEFAEFYKLVDEPKEQARMLTRIAKIYEQQGNLNEALNKLNEAANIYGGLGSQKDVANTMVQLANIYEQQHNAAEALSKLEEAAKIYHVLSQPTDEELDKLDKAARIYLEIGSRVDEANTLINSAKLYYAQRKSAEARDKLNEAARIYREIGTRVDEAGTPIRTDTIYQNQDQDADPLKMLNEAATLYRELGQPAAEAAIRAQMEEISRKRQSMSPAR